MISNTSWIILGLIVVIAVVVWWCWKRVKPSEMTISQVISKKLEDETDGLIDTPQATHEREPQSEYGKAPPPMVFAVNDNGNFDLTDMSGKILNISFGPNPKTYINLLDQAERDITKDDTTNMMISNVGTTKLYKVGGKPYIVNFTRL